MQGDITSQRRWEAYDKLGTFGIYVMGVILVIQVGVTWLCTSGAQPVQQQPAHCLRRGRHARDPNGRVAADVLNPSACDGTLAWWLQAGQRQ